MPVYAYRARDVAGKIVKGSMEVGSKEELLNKLKKMGYMVTRIREAFPEIRMKGILLGWKRIGTEDMLMFSVQLSNMINAGMTILASLEVLTQQVENETLRKIVGEVAKEVRAGDSFSEALAKYPKVFPRLLVSMVRAGEASGKLDLVLLRFARYAEHQADLKQKVKSAFFYPAILLSAGIVVTLYIVTFLVPQFSQLFLKAGIQLPLPTLILYRVGINIKQFWHLIILGVVSMIIAIRFYASTRLGGFQVDRIKLNMPLFRVLFRKAAVSRFARTLATLVASGVPILQSLDIVKDVIGNKVLSNLIEHARQAVEKGERISESLKIGGEFPQDTIKMIAVGEETGTLDEILNKVSDFYDRSLEYTVKKLTTLLEPILLVILGCMVGLIMASMLLPLFDMIKVLRHH